jgi:hypothetical protein
MARIQVEEPCRRIRSAGLGRTMPANKDDVENTCIEMQARNGAREPAREGRTSRGRQESDTQGRSDR